MQSMTYITVDLQRPNGAVVYAKQNDRLSRAVTMSMTDGGTSWTPPAGALAVVRYIKPDGTIGLYDSLENGSEAVSTAVATATVYFAEQMLTVPGDVRAEVDFFTSAGDRLTTFFFLIRVQPSAVSDGEIESTDYFNLLSAQITQVLAAHADLLGLTATATALAAGSTPTVNVSGGSGTPYVFEFGIPRGSTGSRGPAGTAATLQSSEIAYQVSSSGTQIPTGTWSTAVPAVSAGEYLWTRVTLTFNTGSPVVSYSVAYSGSDGSGAVSKVNNISPVNGNITLTAANIQAASGSVQDNINNLSSDVSDLQTYEVRHVTANLTALPVTLDGNAYSWVTANHRIINCVFGTPSAMTSDLTWTTAAGEITLSGTLASSASTTIDFDIVKVAS